MAEINAGSVSVTVVPDARKFDAELKRIQAEIKTKTIELQLKTDEAKADLAQLSAEISATKATITLNPDDTEAKLKLAALQKQASGIKAQLDVDTAPARAEIAQLKLQVSQTKATIQVSSDTAKAQAEAEKLRLEIEASEANIEVGADTKKADAEIDEAARDRTARIKVDVNKSDLSTATAGFSGLTTAALALGPALIPLTAAVGGLAAALAAPVFAAGGALGIFGVIGAGAVKKAESDLKTIQALQKQAGESSTSPAAAAKDRAQAKADLASLPAAERAFLNIQGSIKTAFGSLLAKVGPSVFGPLVQGIKILDNIMPKLAPVVRAVGKALDGMLKQVAGFTKSPGFDKLIRFFAVEGVKSFQAFVTIAANVGAAVGNLAKAFEPLGNSVLSGLVGLTAQFDKFSTSAGAQSGIQKFMAYVQQVGPLVASTFGAIVKAVVHLAVGLAPLGGIVLGVVKAIATFITKLPPSLIGAIAAGLIGVSIAIKAIGIASQIAAVGPMGLIIAALAGLALGLIYAYKHSETFRTIVNKAFADVKAVAKPVLDFLTAAVKDTVNFIAKHWKLLLGILGGPMIAAALVIHNHWSAIRGFFSSAVSYVTGGFESAWSKLEAILTDPLGAAEKAIGKIFRGIKTAFRDVVGDIRSIWGKIEGIIEKPVGFVINDILNPLIDAFNTIGKIVGLKIPTIPTFGGGGGESSTGGSAHASGGVLPGYSPGKDIHHFFSPTGGALHLSGGEGIVRPEVVKAAGRPWLDTLNAAARNGGAAAVKRLLSGHPLRSTRNRFGDYEALFGGDSQAFYDGGQTKFVPPVFTKALKWAEAQQKPGDQYSSPGNFVTTWDCSGFMSSITDILEGQSTRRRVGSTADFPWPGFSKGPGLFTIGSTTHFPGSSEGHMAGNLLGVNVESNAGNGPHYGPSARGPLDPGFGGNIWHLGPAEALAILKAGGGNGGSIAGILRALKGFGSTIGHDISGLSKFGNTPLISDLLTKLPQKLLSAAISKIKAVAESVLGSVTGVHKGNLSALEERNEGLVKTLAGQRGWGSGVEWADLVKLVLSESGFNNTAQNPGSSAYGMFQFLDSTWATVGGHKTSDPLLQTKYGLKYIAERYTNPVNAWNYHLANNSYAKGGILPELMDTGGILTPGRHVIDNLTRGPEYILNQPQMAKLVDGRTQGKQITVNMGPVSGTDTRDLARKITAKERVALAIASGP